MTCFDILNKLGIQVPRDGMIRCVNPAHDDKNPSMWIAPDGKGFKCHGCGVNGNAEKLAILVGVSTEGIIPTTYKPKPKREPRRFYTLKDCLDWLKGTPKLKGYRMTLTHDYKWPDGDLAGVVTRWDSEDNKSYRPLACENGMWRCGKPKVWPPYNAPAIARDFDGMVFVVEGEKACDKAIELGMLATTTAGGSSGIASTDLSILEKRDICIIPDADLPGHKYADAWTTLFPDAMVWEPFAVMGDGYDIADFCEGKTKEQALKLLRKLWRDRG